MEHTRGEEWQAEDERKEQDEPGTWHELTSIRPEGRRAGDCASCPP